MIKKNLLLIGLLISGLSLLAQNFPGKDVELIVGKEIKVLEKAESLQKYGFEGFYKDPDLKRKYACCQSYNSKYDELVNKVFKVISYEPYTNNIGTDKFKLKIENKETGIIYFDYSSEFEHTFPFEVIGGFDYPKGFLCRDISEKIDKFTGDSTFNTPIENDISLIKVKSKKGVTTYLSVNVFGSTANVGIKGAIFLLENGIKIEKPEAEIKVKVSSYGKGYTYSAFIPLNSDDILKFSTNLITDIRLYVYDSKIKDGKKYLEYFKCIIEK